MRFCRIILVLFPFFACNEPRHANIERFWADFQKAIATNNWAAIADMTVFPLKGTEFIGEEYHENGLDRTQFMEQYNQIFDDKIKKAILETSAEKLLKFVSEKEEALQKIGVPPNTEIYSLNVSYVFDEGLETQTESAISFYFLKKEGAYKLAFLLFVG